MKLTIMQSICKALDDYIKHNIRISFNYKYHIDTYMIDI